MGLLETVTTTSSVLTRFLAVIFLRVIPGRYGAFVYWPALVYLATFSLVQLKLSSKTAQSPQLASSSRNGDVKHNEVAVKQAKSAKHQKKPSYAEVAKHGTPADPKKDERARSSTEASAVSKLETTQDATANTTETPGRPSPIKLLFGAPSNSKPFNVLSLLINVALIAMCLDFQFTPLLGLNVASTTFVRVGAVTDTSVKLVARLPPSLWQQRKENHPVEELPNPSGARIVYRPTKPHGAWQYGGLLFPGEETDYVGTIKLEGLLPSTEYEYALVLPEHLEDKRLQPSVHHPHFVRTFPDPRLARHQTHFSFAASSCIKPNWPYVPFQDHTTIVGAAELADRIAKDKLEFLMFMGDFVYADLPHPISSHAAYAKKYRQVLASKEYRRIYEQIPTLHIYDDHEIINDYAGEGNDTDSYFQLANAAYTSYLGQGNPDSPKFGANYYTFQYGDASFFVWDTRRYRTRNEAVDDSEKTMLGAEQKEIFMNWLAEVNQTSTFKFVVSSVPFMTLWGGPNGQLDTWGGFQTERTELMDVMQYVPNVIVLSGDRHEFAAAIIRESVLDFSISPLNQFYLPIRTLSPKTGLGSTGEDRLLKYIPDGSRKFATFEVDTRNAKQPTVSMKLYVDGEEAYNLDILGRPVSLPAPIASVGRNIALSLSELLGFGRGWF